MLQLVVVFTLSLSFSPFADNDLPSHCAVLIQPSLTVAIAYFLNEQFVQFAFRIFPHPIKCDK